MGDHQSSRQCNTRCNRAAPSRSPAVQSSHLLQWPGRRRRGERFAVDLARYAETPCQPSRHSWQGLEVVVNGAPCAPMSCQAVFALSLEQCPPLQAPLLYRRGRTHRHQRLVGSGCYSHCHRVAQASSQEAVSVRHCRLSMPRLCAAAASCPLR